MTDYTHTLTNPGAESGNTSGWTNETNSFGVRTANPAPYNGSYYFYGGAYAESAIYQQVDLITDGVPSADIDNGLIWFWVTWYQASYAGNDQGEVQIRCLNSSYVEITTFFYGLNAITPAQTWVRQDFAPILPANTRYVDIILHAVRNDGTNNDAYFDLITAKSTDVNASEGYLSQNFVEVLYNGVDSTANLSQNFVEVLYNGADSTTNLSQNFVEVLYSTNHIKSDTFKDATAEQAPPGITKRWNGTVQSNILVKDEDGVVDSKVVQEDGDITTSWTYFTLDDPYPVDDCIALIKVKLSSDNSVYLSDYSYFQLILRGTDTYSTCDGYTARISYGITDSDFKLSLGYYSNGEWTQLGSTYNLTENGFNIDWDNWFYMRMYLIGTSVKIMVWGKQDDEPSSYQIEQTDSTITSSGYIGWAWQTPVLKKVRNRIDFINIITDTGASPIVPIEDGSAALNVYKTNVDILAEDNQSNELLVYKTTVDILTSVPSESSSSKVTISIVLF